MPPFPITTSDWAWQSCAGMLEKERERETEGKYTPLLSEACLLTDVSSCFSMCVSLWAFTPVTPSQTERQDKIETTVTFKHHSYLPNLSFVLRHSIEFFTERLRLGAIVWFPQGKAGQESSVVSITSAPAFSVSSRSSIDDTEELIWMVQRTNIVKCHKCASYPTWLFFFCQMAGIELLHCC